MRQSIVVVLIGLVPTLSCLAGSTVVDPQVAAVIKSIGPSQIKALDDEEREKTFPRRSPAS